MPSSSAPRVRQSSPRTRGLNPRRRRVFFASGMALTALLLTILGVGWWNQQQEGSHWVPLQRLFQPAPVQAPVPPVLEADAPTPTLKSNEVALFFSTREPSIKSRAVVRALPTDTASTVERIRFALSQLLKGPALNEQKAGSLSEIPHGTRLLAVNEQGEAITINLSPEFAQGAGATSVQRRVDELVKTVRAIETRRPVYLQVAGKPLQTLSSDGLEIDEPINATSPDGDKPAP